MKRLKEDPKDSCTDSSWNLVGVLSILAPSIDGQVTQGQIARAVNALPFVRSYCLPEFILKQVASAIFRTVREYSQDEQNSSPGSGRIDAIQACFYLDEPQGSLETADPPSTRWGFFMIHKQEHQPDLPPLLIEICIYRE